MRFYRGVVKIFAMKQGGTGFICPLCIYSLLRWPNDDGNVALLCVAGSLASSAAAAAAGCCCNCDGFVRGDQQWRTMMIFVEHRATFPSLLGCVSQLWTDFVQLIAANSALLLLLRFASSRSLKSVSHAFLGMFAAQLIFGCFLLELVSMTTGNSRF